MKPIAWIVMAACLTLTACGGGNDSHNGGSLSSATDPGAPSNPPPPGGGNTSQPQAGWSKAVAMDGKAPEIEPSTTIDANGNALVTWMTDGPAGTLGNEMWGARYVPGSGW